MKKIVAIAVLVVVAALPALAGPEKPRLSDAALASYISGRVSAGLLGF